MDFRSAKRKPRRQTETPRRVFSRLKGDYQRLQNRLETLYEDKLDGRIDVEFFDRKSREWRAEQTRLLDAIKEHQKADQLYMEDGTLALQFRQPFDMLIDANKAVRSAVTRRKFSNGIAATFELCKPNKIRSQLGSSLGLKAGSPTWIPFELFRCKHRYLAVSNVPYGRSWI